MRYLVQVAILLSLAGCGGGGGSAGPTAVPSTYIIGGSVAGLVRPIVLQNNLGDNLSISVDGTFSFAMPVGQGQSYSVTVLSQAIAQNCVVSRGAGTTTAVVTNVSVNCSVDPNGYFIPVVATPVSGKTGGTTGLFVVPSVAQATQPYLVTSEPVKAFAYSLPFVLDNSGNASGGNPSALFYVTQRTGNENHLWLLDLSATSKFVPRQVSSLTFPANASPQHCGVFNGMRNLSDPNSAFLILAMPTDPQNLCGGGNFRYLLVRSTDSANTAPIEVPLVSEQIELIFRQSGALAGLVAVDASRRLSFYPDESFTNPVPLLANVSYFSNWNPNTASMISSLPAAPTYRLLGVHFLDGSAGVYRIDSSGVISRKLFDPQSDIYSSAVDQNNFYWTSTLSTSSGAVESVFQLPLNGSAPAFALYSGPPQVNGALSLAGSTGSILILQHALVIDPVTGSRYGDLLSLPIGAPGVPSPIATYDNLIVARLVAGNLFVNRTVATTQGATTTFAYSTEIRRVNGTIAQSMSGNSFFPYFSTTPLMQVRGITDASSYGGGNVYAIGLSNPLAPTAQVFNQPNGSPFVVPPKAFSFFTFSLSPTQGVGGGATDNGVFALAYDLASSTMVPILMTNTDVRIPWAPFLN